LLHTNQLCSCSWIDMHMKS